MKDQRKPEDRLIDELVESEERSTFFASVEKGIVNRMLTGVHVGTTGMGWGAPLAVLAVVSSIVGAWYVLTTTPSETVVVRVDPTVSVEQNVGSADAVQPPAVTTDVVAAPAAAKNTDADRPVEKRSAPSNMQATASATSTVAEQARREADSLSAELESTTDVARRLSLRYDLGVRLRLIGSTEESLNMLAGVAAEANGMGAMVLSARSSQQAAVAAYDLGRTVLAVELMQKALERYPDKNASPYRRWQQQLNEWKR